MVAFSNVIAGSSLHFFYTDAMIPNPSVVLPTVPCLWLFKFSPDQNPAIQSLPSRSLAELSSQDAQLSKPEPTTLN